MKAEMTLMKNLIVDQNRIIKEQSEKIDELDHTAARRSEVEYAILTNTSNMNIKAKMDIVKMDSL